MKVIKIIILLLSLSSLPIHAAVTDQYGEVLRKSAEYSTDPNYLSNVAEEQLRVRLMPDSWFPGTPGNPISVRLSNGTSFYNATGGGGGGSGSQYINGDLSAGASGNLILGDDGTNLKSIKVNSSRELQVGVVSSVLPTGAATENKQDSTNTKLDSLLGLDFATSAKQNTGNTSLGSIDTKLSSQATAAKQDTGNTSLGSIDGKTPALVSGRVPVDGSGVTQPISGSVTANLGTLNGAATSAKQDTGNNSLSSIDGKIPTLPRSVSGTVAFGGTSTVTLDLTTNGGGINSASFEALGTFTGDIAIEGSTNGTDFYLIDAIEPVQNGTSNYKSSYLNSSHSRLVASASGLKKVRVNSSGVILSGSSDIVITGSSASINTSTMASASTQISDLRENDQAPMVALNDLLTADCSGRSMLEIEVEGTWVGTISISTGIASGGTLIATKIYPLGGGSGVTSISSNGKWEMPCGGLFAIYLQMTAYTSGTALVSTNTSVGSRMYITADPTLASGGAGGTQYQEDAASAADPVGNMLIARRRDSLSAETSTDGDNTALNSTSKGELYVKHVDPISAAQSGTWNITNISGTVSLPTGASTGTKQDTGNTSLSSIDGKFTTLNAKDFATSAKQDTGNTSLSSIDTKLTSQATASNQTTEITSLQLIDDAVATNGSGAPTKSYLVSGSDGTNARALSVSSAGRLSVDVNSSALPSGAATLAKQPALGTAGTASSDVITVQGIASMTALKVDGSAVTQPVSGTVTANQGGSWTVTANAGTNLNTSALALEAGGNLALIKTSVQLIDDAINTNGNTNTGSSIEIAGVDDTGKTRQVMTTDEGVIVTKGARDSELSISFNESVAAPTAATWYLKRKWTPPSPYYFRPSRTKSIVTTAGSRTFIGVGKRLGTFNTGTNAFTDDQSVSAPNHYSRLFGCVTTVLSATLDNITVTYTDDQGNTSHATAATAFAASSPVGNCFEFPLAATTGQMADNGVRDVTAVSDSAATTGVVEIWGLNSLHDTLGVANAFEVGSFDDSVITTAETIMIMLQQAATTAQQRGATIVGSISNR